MGRFRRSNFLSDARGTALDRIREASESDLLLIDLISERHGIYRQGNSVLTRSIDGIAAHAYDDFSWDYIPFGSLEHFRLFSHAWDRYVTELKDIGLYDRTLVLHSAWATWTSDNKRCRQSLDYSTRRMNLMYEPYFSLVRLSGVNVLRIPRNLCVADPNHRWGEAPFHYVQDFYRYVATYITHEILESRDV